MRESPILFSAPMVRAILDDRKTVTRPVVSPAPYVQQVAGMYGGGMLCFPDRKKKGRGLIWPNAKADILAQAPYQVGDRLWVRETWRGIVEVSPPDAIVPEVGVARYVPAEDHCLRIEYAATQAHVGEPWRSSIHMPRWASRITLEITNVRVERLQDISAEDTIAEGMVSNLREHDAVIDLRQQFADLWDGLAKPGSRWSDNPWAWVVAFKRVGVARD